MLTSSSRIVSLSYRRVSLTFIRESVTIFWESAFVSHWVSSFSKSVFFLFFFPFKGKVVEENVLIPIMGKSFFFLPRKVFSLAGGKGGEEV